MNQVSPPPPPSPPSGLEAIRDAMEVEVVASDGGVEGGEGEAQGEWDEALQAYIYPDFDVKED